MAPNRTEVHVNRISAGKPDAARAVLLDRGVSLAKTGAQIHQQAQLYSSLDEAKAAINALPLERYQATVASAHVMGGCNFSADPANGVVRTDGRHHQLANLSVLDGSVLPTSLGANPQLTIYGLTWRNTELLIEQLRKA